MDEIDDPEASRDLKTAVQNDPSGRQVVLDCLKQGKYLRTATWLAAELQIEGAKPILEKISGEYESHAKAALAKFK